MVLLTNVLLLCVVAQTSYVPQAPHMWNMCGTKTSPPQDGNKFQIWYSKSEKVENQPL